jgi:Acetyl-CoA dehydrogenase C-terminal like
MAKAQDIATRKLSGDAEFYRAKLQIARCYFEHVLPESVTLAHIVTDGGGSIADADAALL